MVLQKFKFMFNPKAEIMKSLKKNSILEVENSLYDFEACS